MTVFLQLVLSQSSSSSLKSYTNSCFWQNKEGARRSSKDMERTSLISIVAQPQSRRIWKPRDGEKSKQKHGLSVDKRQSFQNWTLLDKQVSGFLSMKTAFLLLFLLYSQISLYFSFRSKEGFHWRIHLIHINNISPLRWTNL